MERDFELVEGRATGEDREHGTEDRERDGGKDRKHGAEDGRADGSDPVPPPGDEEMTASLGGRSGGLGSGMIAQQLVRWCRVEEVLSQPSGLAMLR
jgi:hypothetical protein